MIKTINIKNLITNKEITFKSTGNYILDEIDWDAPSISAETYRIPYQVGETLAGVKVGTRKPTLVGYVIADTSELMQSGMTWEEYYKAQEEQIQDYKEVLDRVISVYQDVEITVGEYRLIARATQPPKYSTNEEQNNEVLCRVVIELECFSPMFYGNSKEFVLATTSGMFRFPLALLRNNTVLGEIMRRQSVGIENAGDSPVGCIIHIGAKGGTVQEPKIYNVTTGNYIGFDSLILNDGDYVTINTNIGEESVIKHVSETSKDINVVGNLLRGSKFIQISQGFNHYAYEVQEAYKNNIEVFISFTEQYFNIRGE